MIQLDPREFPDGVHRLLERHDRVLRELTKHNDKKWFDANRERLDEVWLEPAKEFILAVGPRLKKFAPQIRFEPKVGRSLMRMNRDMRFSPD